MIISNLDVIVLNFILQNTSQKIDHFFEKKNKYR